MLDDPILSSLRVEITDAHRTPLNTAWKWQDYSDDVSRIYYIESGEAVAFHHGREFRMRPDSAFLIPARTVMNLRCPEHCVQHWVHFRATVLGSVDLFDFLPCEYAVAVYDPALFLRLLGRLELAAGSMGSRFEASGILLQLLAPFLALADPGPHARRQKGILRFHPVLAHVDAHLAEPLGVDDLAAVAHLERTHFSREFSRHFAVSPARYMQQKRIEKAKRLLWETNQTLDFIAAELGFADGFHFSKVFKRIAGLSPRAFRQQPRDVP